MVVTPHAEHLRALAQRLAAPFVDLGAVAVLIGGSAATGDCDAYSDLDLILYYDDELPSDVAIVSAMDAHSASNRTSLGADREAGYIVEQWDVAGIACQFVHSTLAQWKVHAATVLEAFDTKSPVQKALWGTLHALPIHGDDVVDRLRSDAEYPDGLAKAMVERNLDVFPLWYFAEAFAARDAIWWRHSELVRGLSKVLALLAGANRVFFTTFQLKHMRAFIDAFAEKPADLANRVEQALAAPAAEAAFMLETLLGEALDIVERLVPDADVSAARARIGRRQQPWELPD